MYSFVFILFGPHIRQGRITSGGLDREIATNQTLCVALDLTAHIVRLFHVISVLTVNVAQRLEPNMIGTTLDFSIYLGWAGIAGMHALEELKDLKVSLNYHPRERLVSFVHILASSNMYR